MTDLSTPQRLGPSRPAPASRLRFVTAAALFDGHDAAINIVRRILQASGVEVVHLGHNRSVAEVARAALDEDVDGVAVSSYQGGHVEYFKYLVDALREGGGERILVFGGGGGVIVADEIEALERYGIERIYSPHDGQRLGLQGMIDDMLARCSKARARVAVSPPDGVATLPLALDGGGPRTWRALAVLISALESGRADAAALAALAEGARAAGAVPVLGVTGTGGAGKSSLTDELVRRFRLDYGDELSIAILAIDPSRRKSGGALLGDRIRMNAIGDWGHGPRVFMRSLATRDAATELPDVIPDAIAACKAARFDLIIVETSGIGQGDAAVAQVADRSLYVMTPEFGAASQLEKIDMLDFADFVAINKFDRSGALDALRDVAKQMQRNRGAFAEPPEQMPVVGTIASRFNDEGVTALYQRIVDALRELGLRPPAGGARLPRVEVRHAREGGAIVPAARVRYLSEIGETVRAYRERVDRQAQCARERWQLCEAKRMAMEVDGAAADAGKSEPASSTGAASSANGPGADASGAAASGAAASGAAASGAAASGADASGADALITRLDALIAEREARLDAHARALLDAWPKTVAEYAGDERVVTIRGREVRTPLTVTTLSGTSMRKVSLPKFVDPGETLRWLMLENLPGYFPFTAGVFPFKRENEDPTRMFAGEGDPPRTNRRFKLLSEGMPARRLSTAFDSVTLYGEDPDARPDIYGKIGNSGVSVATLDDMKALYDGFDLCDPATSVSMTINGPAPTILAMFFNAAIDQQLERLARRCAAQGGEPSAEEIARTRANALRDVRGTVQADILKEDQGQNTCIFSTDFSHEV